jgi:hypothetical protein
MAEPFRLKEWRLAGPSPGLFYTCARPGRSRGSKGSVPDRLVLDWARGLPGCTETFIISLLGRKPKGTSEFSFYSSFNDPDSFEWLNTLVAGRKFHVISHPTTDLEDIEPSILAMVANDVTRLVSESKTVVIIDSGGWTRTRAVAAHLGAILVSTS